MSRIGKKPIPLPKGVTVKIDGRVLDVQGPKGKLRQPVPPGIVLRAEGRRARGHARDGRPGSWASSTAWRAAWWRTPSRA